jgi:hypothetical protein
MAAARHNRTPSTHAAHTAPHCLVLLVLLSPLLALVSSVVRGTLEALQ